MSCSKIRSFNFTATKVIFEGGGHLLLRRRRINELQTPANMLTLYLRRVDSCQMQHRPVAFVQL